MKKRISLALCAIALCFGLVACGGNSGEVKYGDYTEADLEYFVESMLYSVSAMSAEEAQQYADYYANSDDENAAAYAGMFENWVSTVDAGLGENLGSFSEFKIDKTGKTLTVSVQGDYSVRNCKMVVVFKTYNMEISSINIEPVYTLGETMGKAGLNTIMGILIVFVMLVVMSLVIYLFKYINTWGQPKKTAEPAPVAAAVAPVAAVADSGTDDLELVAVIAAAIAASTGASTDSFVVRSIRKRS